MSKRYNILITGSEGMIGKELILLLKEKYKLEKGTVIYEADLKLGNDLRNYDECLDLCDGMSEIYHLAGIKGNPKMTNERPADFMRMLQFDTNMIYAAQEMRVKKFLYTSSIAVEHPESDKYPAWAKKTAETLIETMRIQYPDGTKYAIVRPANVFGKYDNFENPNAMVITSLIKKAIVAPFDFEVWGDGSQERDFISATDIARGMIKVMENDIGEPVNLCSGIGVKIRDVADAIGNSFNKKVIYNKDKQVGEQRRVMEAPFKLYKKIGFEMPPGIFIKRLREVI